MSTFPVTRLRRLRRTGALRAFARETHLDLDQFVMPLFAGPDTKANAELPALGRFSVDDLVRETESLVAAGVTAVILFGIPPEKDEVASGAYDDDGIVQQALRALRPRFPELVLMTDVCLCEYTSHGHCGVLKEGAAGSLHGDEVDNDETLDLLARTAVSHVEAGADVVAPSDMMDGRVRAIREALDDHGFETTPILAYSPETLYAASGTSKRSRTARMTSRYGSAGLTISTSAPSATSCSHSRSASRTFAGSIW